MMNRHRRLILSCASSGGERRWGERAVSRCANAFMIIAVIIALLVLRAGLFGGCISIYMIKLGAGYTNLKDHLFEDASFFGSKPSETTFMNSLPIQQEEEPEVQVQVKPEKIVAGPQNIKERTAIYVFLSWLWVSIGVLVYVLRLKIKEVDRLHAIKFFSPSRK